MWALTWDAPQWIFQLHEAFSTALVPPYCKWKHKLLWWQVWLLLRHQLGFLLCRSQDTFICIQNFEHETNGWPDSGSRSRVTAPRHVELGLGRGFLAIPGIGRVENWSVFIGRFCLQGMLLVLFSSIFFPSGAGTATWFLEVFFSSHEKFWPWFGGRIPLRGHVVSIRFYVKYTRCSIIIHHHVFNQQCQNPRATEIIIDRQTVFSSSKHRSLPVFLLMVL